MTRRRLLNFAVVGVANTAVYYSSYLAFVSALPYLVAHVCAFVIAMTCSYFLNCRYTFRVSPQWRSFALYPLSNLLSLSLSTVGMRIAVGGLGASAKLAPLVVGVACIPITYIVARSVLVAGAETRRESSSDANASSESPEIPAGRTDGSPYLAASPSSLAD